MLFFVTKAAVFALPGYVAAKSKSIISSWNSVFIFGFFILCNLGQKDYFSALFWAGLIYLIYQGIAAGPIQLPNTQKLNENSLLDASA